MNLKKIAGTATLAGALSAAALGLVGGIAGAQPKPNPHPPVVPENTNFNQPPGHVGQDLGVPPGQFKQSPSIKVVAPSETPTVINNPFFTVPPGQWRNTPFVEP